MHFPRTGLEQITLTTELGEGADEVTIHIFDTAGRIVRERSTASPSNDVFSQTFDV